MIRSSKFSFLIPILVLISMSACGVEPEEPARAPAEGPTGIPAEFVAGSYEVIGRFPDSEQPYSGTMKIRLSDPDSNALSITRTIGGVSIQGNGLITTTAGDAITVLRVHFEEPAGTIAATYLIESDLDNYARLTGYVYAKDGRTILPGIEALFHDHYKER